MNYFVKVYFRFFRIHTFTARDKENAFEIAGRIIQEGAWISNLDGTDEFFPPGWVCKVKVYQAAAQAPDDSHEAHKED